MARIPQGKFRIPRLFLLAGGLFLMTSTGAMAQGLIAWLRAQFLQMDTVEDAKADQPDLVQHDIDSLGSCHFFASRGTRWKQTFADGSRLELTCDPDPGSLLPGFHLWYQAEGEKRVEIGRCIFDDGFNHGWYYTFKDHPGLAKVEWVSMDGGKDDKGPRHIDKTHVTGPEEPYIDVVHWIFHTKDRRLERISDKYEYAAAGTQLPHRPGEAIEPFVGPRVPDLRRTYGETVQ